MPTPDYTSQAAGYQAKLLGQNRSNTSAVVTANEQFDRDNLLHFIEANFASDGTAVSIENFRAFLHVLVKSVNVQKDDYSRKVLLNRACRISTAAATRNYYPSPYYGFNYTLWSTFMTGTFTSTSLPNISATQGNSFPETLLDSWDLTARGYVQNASSTGEVEITMWYADPDDATNTNMQNNVFIGQTTVDCAITDTDYAWIIQHTGKIPAGKKIITFVRNVGWTSGSENIYFSQGLTFATHNSSYSQT